MKNKKNITILMVGFVTTLSLSSAVNAEIYKCTDNQNKVYYNDKPCPQHDKETQIKNAKDPKGVSANDSSDMIKNLGVADEQTQDVSQKMESKNKSVAELERTSAQERYKYMNSQEYLEGKRE